MQKESPPNWVSPGLTSSCGSVCPKPDQGVIRVNSKSNALLRSALPIVALIAVLLYFQFSLIALAVGFGVGLRFIYEAYKTSREVQS